MPILASAYADASTASVAVAGGRPTLLTGPGPGTPFGAPLVFTFQQPIQLGSGALSIYGPTGTVYSGAIGAVPGLTVAEATLVYAGPFPLVSASHTFVFSAGSVLDLDGKALNGAESIEYTFFAPRSPEALNATGTPGADRLLGSDGADILDGAGGDDELYGYGGNDVLRGDDGDDFIDGDAGNDLIDGGAGDDWLLGGSGDDRINGGAGDDRLFGDAGDDELHGGAGNDVLSDHAGGAIMYGGDGDDQLSIGPGMYAPAGRQQLYGGDGNDMLTMTGGAGLLDGGEGNDALSFSDYRGMATGLVEMDGGAGNDHLSVHLLNSAMTVELSGGSGSDLFTIDSGAGNGTITILDFQAGAGGDVLDVIEVFDAMLIPIVAPFASAHLRFEQRGADTVLQGDLDGVGTAHGFKDLVLLANVARETLVAANMRYGHIPGEVVTPGQRYDGTDGPDRIEGGAGADRLAGNAGADVLIGGAGNDILDGGAGLDTALYTGARGDYEIRRAGSGWEVDDKRGGVQDGRDALSGVERLLFSDGALAFDVAPGDGVSQASRLYHAAFDRAPDQAGLGYWISRLDAGADLPAMASAFVQSAEFRDLYGAAPDNAAFLHQLYLNVFDREPDAGGFAFWLDALDSGRAPLADVLLGFSESAEHIAATTPLVAQPVPYQPFIG